MNFYTKEWILSIPKIINNNGCWISNYATKNNGYVSVHIGGINFLLHRVVISLWSNLSYSDNFESRHSTNCNRACFNPDHLKPGTVSDNQMDAVKDKTHKETRKINCTNCGSEYSNKKVIDKFGNTKTHRFCNECRKKRRIELNKKKKNV